jgi:hypothetical protein
VALLVVALAQKKILQMAQKRWRSSRLERFSR